MKLLKSHFPFDYPNLPIYGPEIQALRGALIGIWISFGEGLLFLTSFQFKLHN